MEKKLTEGPVDPFGMENEMEKGKPKVSVVIPVYNTEKYLEATLQSIRNQTCCEIEIIVIDDGSTDCSAEIVRGAADEDGRIVLVSQPNRGLSLARNAGIARASGEFVYFMDSDDLLEKDALETCYRKCTEQRLDFVIFDAKAFSDEGADIPGIRYERTQGMRDRVYDGRELLALLLREGRYLPSACLSFVRLGLTPFLPGHAARGRTLYADAVSVCRASRLYRARFFQASGPRGFDYDEPDFPAQYGGVFHGVP